MFTNKLSYKFVVPISLLIIISSLFLGVVFIRQQSSVLRVSAQEKADMLARNLAYNAEYGVLLKEPSILKGLIEGVMTEKDVVWVAIKDDQGAILITSGEKQEPFYETEANVVIMKTTQKKSTTDQMMVQEKQQSVHEEVVGQVRLGVSLSGTVRKINELKIKAMAIFLVQILLVIAIILFLTKTVTSPLEELALIAGKVAAGDLTIQMRVRTKDEIGDLADSFNKMVEQLAENLQKVTESKNDLDAVITNMVDGLVVFDPAGAIQMVNDAAKRMLGYDDDDLVGKPVSSLIPIEARGNGDGPAVFQKLTQDKVIRDVELELQHKSGKKISVLLSGSVLKNNAKGEASAVVVARDLTERIKLEMKLRQSEKMSAIGQLAAGIAHDFNNLLTVILGNCSIVERSVQGENELTHYGLKEIRKAGERSSSLTRQLLAFSRKQVLVPKVTNLNEIVTNIESMLRRMIGEDVELATFLEPELGPIKIDPSQIEQVLMNLAINARDAMANGGKIIIETVNVRLDQSYAAHPIGLEPGNYIGLKVSDTGSGMDAETQSHIFEPFFTTKEQGKGTGLGLSTVYGIVKQSGGEIQVYSEPGNGTTFRIYFPRFEENSGPSTEAKTPAVQLEGSETILLVEDEEMVRNFVRAALQAYKYKIIEARDGNEALSKLEQHKDDIQLLLTDAIMPGMNGQELANQVLVRAPNVKILFMSGYTENTNVLQNLIKKGVTYIEKPFTLETLAKKVREALGGA